MYSKALQSIGKPTTYFPSFAIAFGDLKTGVFLSNFLYWEGKQLDVDGWIYKRQVDITKETGLSRKEQEYARKKLKELNCLEETKRSIPAKLYYRFDWDEIDKFISQSISKLPEKKKKSNKVKEEKEPTLIYKFKELFDSQYSNITNGLNYQWSTKDKGGGKDWRYLKLLIEPITNRTKSKFKREPTEKEILETFKNWIENIPKWYEHNAFSPSVLYSKFNEITAAMIQEHKQNGSSQKPKDYSEWIR